MRTEYFKVRCLASLSFFAYIMLIPPLTVIFLARLLLQSSFKLSDGDEVTCTPFKYLYPATTWQSGPYTEPIVVGTDPLSSSKHSAIKQAEQVFKAEERACRIGQVPMRTATGEPSLQIIPGRKTFPRSTVILDAEQSTSTLWLEDQDGHNYAVASIKGAYRGTQGFLNLWQPHVEEGEFSLAQVWVAHLDKQGVRHCLEAGWQIYEDLYKDRRPRLFTFWTVDNYTTSGCYNLDCKGFVQISSKVLLGGSFAAVSTTNSMQYEIKLGIFLDYTTGDWWLQVNNEYVGYWPKVLLASGGFNTTFGSSNTRIDWGGEVWHQPGHCTATQMGSGQHPSFAGYGRAAYVRNMQVATSDNHLAHLPNPHPVSSFPHCCHIVVRGSESNTSTGWGTHVFFGGPGFNKECTEQEDADSVV